MHRKFCTIIYIGCPVRPMLYGLTVLLHGLGHRWQICHHGIIFCPWKVCKFGQCFRTDPRNCCSVVSDTCLIFFPFAYSTCFSHLIFHIMSRAPPQLIPAHLGSMIIISSLRLTALLVILHYAVIFIILVSPPSCI